MKHRTARGQIVDIDAIMNANQHVVALGNANMNARGDILDKDGKVIKSREDIANEYYNNRQTQAKAISLKEDMPENFFQTPEEALKRLQQEQQQKSQQQQEIIPSQQQNNSKKKIVEKED